MGSLYYSTPITTTTLRFSCYLFPRVSRPRPSSRKPPKMGKERRVPKGEEEGEGKDLTKTIKTDFFQADESSNPLLTVAPFRVPPRLSNLSFSSSPPDSLFRLPSDLVNSWWKISKNRRNLFLAKCHCCESCASYDSSIINDEGIYYIIGCIFRVEQWQQSSFWGERGVNNRCFRFIC